MPKVFVFATLLLYLMGSVFAEALILSGYLEPPFYHTDDAGIRAYIYLIFSSVMLYVSILFFCRVLAVPLLSNNVLYIKSNIKRGAAIVLVLLFLLYGFFLLFYYYEDIQRASVVRHSGNQTISRVTFLLMLVSMYASAKFKTYSQLLIIAFIIFISTIYPSMTSSRAVALPFFVAMLLFVAKKEWILSVLFLYLSLVALFCAFSTRADPSYANFWHSFTDSLVSFDIVLLIQPVLQYSLPGMSTLVIALDQFESVTLTKLIEFLVYLSPLPSIFLTESMLSRSSLSGILGIDINVLGINSDIYSEGAYWFGIYGSAIYPFAIGFFCVLPFKALRYVWRTPPSTLYYVAYFTVFYMLAGGMVFTLRAGSRFVLAFVLIILAVSVIRKLLSPKEIETRFPYSV